MFCINVLLPSVKTFKKSDDPIVMKCAAFMCKQLQFLVF